MNISYPEQNNDYFGYKQSVYVNYERQEKVKELQDFSQKQALILRAKQRRQKRKQKKVSSTSLNCLRPLQRQKCSKNRQTVTVKSILNTGKSQNSLKQNNSSILQQMNSKKQKIDEKQYSSLKQNKQILSKNENVPPNIKIQNYQTSTSISLKLLVQEKNTQFKKLERSKQSPDQSIQNYYFFDNNDKNNNKNTGSQQKDYQIIKQTNQINQQQINDKQIHDKIKSSNSQKISNQMKNNNSKCSSFKRKIKIKINDSPQSTLKSIKSLQKNKIVLKKKSSKLLLTPQLKSNKNKPSQNISTRNQQLSIEKDENIQLNDEYFSMNNNITQRKKLYIQSQNNLGKYQSTQSLDKGIAIYQYHSFATQKHIGGVEMIQDKSILRPVQDKSILRPSQLKRIQIANKSKQKVYKSNFKIKRQKLKNVAQQKKETDKKKKSSIIKSKMDIKLQAQQRDQKHQNHERKSKQKNQVKQKSLIREPELKQKSLIKELQLKQKPVIRKQQQQLKPPRIVKSNLTQLKCSFQSVTLDQTPPVVEKYMRSIYPQKSPFNLSPISSLNPSIQIFSNYIGEYKLYLNLICGYVQHTRLIYFQHLVDDQQIQNNFVLFKMKNNRIKKYQAKYEIVCFFMFKKIIYENKRIIKSLKGSQPNIFKLSGLHVPDKVLLQFSSNKLTTTLIERTQNETRVIFRNLQQKFKLIKHKPQNKQTPTIKLQTPCDNFTKYLVENLIEQINELTMDLEVMRNQTDKIYNTNFALQEQIHLTQERILQAMELVFLFMELKGNKVKKIHIFNKNKIQFHQYYQTYVDQLLDTYQYFSNI